MTTPRSIWTVTLKCLFTCWVEHSQICIWQSPKIHRPGRREMCFKFYVYCCFSDTVWLILYWFLKHSIWMYTNTIEYPINIYLYLFMIIYSKCTIKIDWQSACLLLYGYWYCVLSNITSTYIYIYLYIYTVYSNNNTLIIFIYYRIWLLLEYVAKYFYLDSLYIYILIHCTTFHYHGHCLLLFSGSFYYTFFIGVFITLSCATVTST